MNKKSILLFCSAGMSTTLLVEKMKKAAHELDKSVEIAAYPVSEISQHAPNADVLLLGPQVRYLEEKVLKDHPDKKVEVISLRDYGMMDGKKVLEQAMNA